MTTSYQDAALAARRGVQILVSKGYITQPSVVDGQPDLTQAAWQHVARLKDSRNPVLFSRTHQCTVAGMFADAAATTFGDGGEIVGSGWAHSR